MAPAAPVFAGKAGSYADYGLQHLQEPALLANQATRLLDRARAAAQTSHGTPPSQRATSRSMNPRTRGDRWRLLG